jgi:hypothetical protein
MALGTRLRRWIADQGGGLLDNSGLTAWFCPREGNEAMGVLADIFVSKPEDAEVYEQAMLDQSFATDRRFTYVQYKRVTSLEFAQLRAILANEPFEYRTHKFVHICHTEGTTLDQFPPDAVALLSAMPPETIKSVAEKWCRIEELRCEPEDVEPVLADLQRLARLAEVEGKGMYIWNSV